MNQLKSRTTLTYSMKEAKDELEKPYLFATIDGRKEKAGNFRAEPPGLFRGRGEHPRKGTLKVRSAVEILDSL